jgi:hypothetical protein
MLSLCNVNYTRRGTQPCLRQPAFHCSRLLWPDRAFGPVDVCNVSTALAKDLAMNTPEMMDVVICQRPGTLVVEQRPVPVPAANDVLLRVRRVGMCGTDMHIFRGVQPYLRYPRARICRALPVVRGVQRMSQGQTELLQSSGGTWRPPRRGPGAVRLSAGAIRVLCARRDAGRGCNDRVSGDRSPRSMARWRHLRAARPCLRKRADRHCLRAILEAAWQ